MGDIRGTDLDGDVIMISPEDDLIKKYADYICSEAKPVPVKPGYYELHLPATDGIDRKNDEPWRKEQLRKLWILIGMAATGVSGAGKKWRMNVCYQILRRRLWRQNRCEWISLLAGFSDTQIIGDIRNKMLQNDMILIRNMAKYACSRWHKKVI